VNKLDQFRFIKVKTDNYFEPCPRFFLVADIQLSRN